MAAGKGHPQPAVRVLRMTHGGKVQVVGQAVVVSVTVGQAPGGVIAHPEACSLFKGAVSVSL